MLLALRPVNGAFGASSGAARKQAAQLEQTTNRRRPPVTGPPDTRATAQQTTTSRVPSEAPELGERVSESLNQSVTLLARRQAQLRARQDAAHK